MDIIAHRGASGIARENTLTAFRLAWDLGADGIELDVHLSADRRIMVHHDAVIKSNKGAELTLASTDSATLRGIDVQQGRNAVDGVAYMPFLEEVFALTPLGKQIWIEIKCGEEIVAPLAAILNRTEVNAQVILISFHTAVLQACRSTMPAIPCYWIIADDTLENMASSAMDCIAKAHRWGFVGLDPYYPMVTADFIAATHNAGLKLNAWTVNDIETGQALHDLGMDAITTDYPDLLQQVPKNRR